jgi:16S rRNA (adenine1518-N6/adenine1519-N6)-dimethyltransferase
MIPAAEPFPDARALLHKHGLGAKKSFGQNFLTSERAFRAIVDATVQHDDDWIVEIGAGLGTLTARLAERVVEGKVIALERDRDMVGVLRAELGTVENVQIEEVDALRYDLTMVARWRRGRGGRTRAHAYRRHAHDPRRYFLRYRGPS